MWNHWVNDQWIPTSSFMISVISSSSLARIFCTVNMWAQQWRSDGGSEFRTTLRPMSVISGRTEAHSKKGSFAHDNSMERGPARNRPKQSLWPRAMCHCYAKPALPALFAPDREIGVSRHQTLRPRREISLSSIGNLNGKKTDSAKKLARCRLCESSRKRPKAGVGTGVDGERGKGIALHVTSVSLP